MDSTMVQLIREAGIQAINIIKETAPVAWGMTYNRMLIDTVIGLLYSGSFSLITITAFLFGFRNRKNGDNYIAICVVSIFMFACFFIWFGCCIENLLTLDFITAERIITLIR